MFQVKQLLEANYSQCAGSHFWNEAMALELYLLILPQSLVLRHTYKNALSERGGPPNRQAKAQLVKATDKRLLQL